MPFNLDQFRAKFVNGGARPSQFEMRISWPQSVRDAGLASRMLPFMCQTSEIPASTVSDVAVPYFGRKLYYLGDREFTPLTVRIINDEDFVIRRALEYWLKDMLDHSTSTSKFNGGNTPGSYATDAVVSQYSRNSGGNFTPIRSYKFIGLFPTSVGAIPLDWAQTDSFESFDATFRYQWWEVENDATPNLSTNVGININA